MLYPTIQELTGGKINRYELVIAAAKGARIVRRINAEERFRMEKVLDVARQTASGSDSIDIKKLDLGNVYYVGIDLEKATHEELDRIGELVRQAGIPCSVSY